jgi:hypothetical protein
MRTAKQNTTNQIPHALRFIVCLLKDCGLDAYTHTSGTEFIVSILQNHVILSKVLADLRELHPA